MNNNVDSADLDPLEQSPVRTTQPPCLDVAEVVPEIAETAQTTVRLHPRRLPQEQSLPRDESKLGGEFLWPAAEPWPVCPRHEIPWVGVLQLRQEDFPEVEFKSGMDLLQVLWCPQHGHGSHTPEPVIFWRNAAEIVDPLANIPLPRFPTPAEEEEERRQSALQHDLNWLTACETHPVTMQKLWEYQGGFTHPSSGTWIPQSFFDFCSRPDVSFAEVQAEAARLIAELKPHYTIPKFAARDYVPYACRLFPERVTEYSMDELDDEQLKRLPETSVPECCVTDSAQERSLGHVLGAQLTIADGTKLLGYANWSQYPEQPHCQAGHSMEHLLTIASWEWSATSWPRWRPIEDGDLYERLRAAGRYDAAETLISPHGMTLGDAAEKYIFICRQCPGWPFQSIIRD